MRLFTIPWLCFCTSLLLANTDERTIVAVRTTLPPSIDGYGTDEVWKSAVPVSDFTQSLPIEGAEPTERTEIRAAYDDNALYFFCMMYDSSPNSIVQRLTRRDDEIESDYISIRIDSYHDHQTGFEFTINASGSKVDILQFDDGNKEDDSWDPVWEAETRIMPDGWAAEVKLPLSILRFNENASTWGINFIRRISRKQERDHWALVKKSDNGFISHFGHLTGLNGLHSPTRLEILPYSVANGTFLSQKSSRERQQRFLPSAGFDAKYGLTSNFTVDLTVNPDFGQVEADPEVLNLTTFETFYPEKRPFFIEGTQILRFTTFGGEFGPGLFYSRRIGRAIHIDPPAGAIITEEPRSATILGAAKISGKTENGLSVGILEATTGEEEYTYRDTAGRSTTTIAEPFSNFGLIRLKQDFWSSSNVGMMATSVSRKSGTPAFTGGLDWNLKFDNNTHVIDGFLAGSSVSRFQELRQGAAGKIRYGKDGGIHWLYDISEDFTSKKYNINDLGFFFRPNDYGTVANVTYKEDLPGTMLRSYRLSYMHHIRNNFDNVRLIQQGRLRLLFELLNYYVLEAAVGYDMQGFDDRESRGYGLYRTPQRHFSRFEIQTDERNPVVGRFEENFTYDLTGGRTHNLTGSVDIRPTSAMTYEIGLGYLRVRNFEGFVDTSGGLSIFGRRDVDQTDLTMRGSLIFSQTLSLQVYAQLFFAKGRYYDFSFIRPSSDLVAYAYAGNNDFNRTALNSNIVLRWEYLPGSTMYLVWSHGRRYDEFGRGYARRYGENVTNTFSVAPDNVFLLKVSYWWSM